VGANTAPEADFDDDLMARIGGAGTLTLHRTIPLQGLFWAKDVFDFLAYSVRAVLRITFRLESEDVETLRGFRLMS